MEDTVSTDKQTEGLSIRAPEMVRAAIRHGAAIRNVSQSDFMIGACRELLQSMNGEVLLPNQFEEIPSERPGMMTIRLPPDVLEEIRATAPRAYQKATQFVLWASLRAFYETPDKARGAINQAVMVSGQDRAEFIVEACNDLLDNLDEAMLEDFDDVLLDSLESSDDKLPAATTRRITAAWDEAWDEAVRDSKRAIDEARKEQQQQKKKDDAAKERQKARKVELAKQRHAALQERAATRNKTREKRYFIVQAAMRAYFELRERYANE
jgi:uncharacterized protein (DUF1778 family)